MRRKGKGSKPTKVQKNFENSSHIGSPFVSRKPNQTHHVGTIHLDYSDNNSGVVQPIESKRETMADHEIYVEGSGENQDQVSKEQSTFVFPILDPDIVARMKNIPPSTLPHLCKKPTLHKAVKMIYVTNPPLSFEYQSILVGVHDIQLRSGRTVTS